MEDHVCMTYIHVRDVQWCVSCVTHRHICTKKFRLSHMTPGVWSLEVLWAERGLPAVGPFKNSPAPWGGGRKWTRHHPADRKGSIDDLLSCSKCFYRIECSSFVFIFSLRPQRGTDLHSERLDKWTCKDSLFCQKTDSENEVKHSSLIAHVHILITVGCDIWTTMNLEFWLIVTM